MGMALEGREGGEFDPRSGGGEGVGGAKPLVFTNWLIGALDL